MDLLIQLGVNHTLGIQMAVFLVSFVILKYVLFEPYFAAFNERKERTVGRTELAERFVSETRELEEKFAARALEANDRFREAFDKSRGEAVKEYDRLVLSARSKAKSLTDDASRKIGTEMESARAQLSKEIPAVAQLINQKLIGKDLNA